MTAPRPHVDPEQWGPECECSWGSANEGGHHDLMTHGPTGWGPCTALDSYGQPCACTGLVPIPDDEEE